MTLKQVEEAVKDPVLQCITKLQRQYLKETQISIVWYSIGRTESNMSLLSHISLKMPKYAIFEHSVLTHSCLEKIILRIGKASDTLVLSCPDLKHI